jgi:ABC-2 type transport system ATP-binding protein
LMPEFWNITVGGRHYRDYPAPLQEVGALLEARSLHPGWSAFKHLLGLALTHGIARRRVDEVIALAGLEEVAPDT